MKKIISFFVLIVVVLSSCNKSNDAVIVIQNGHDTLHQYIPYDTTINKEDNEIEINRDTLEVNIP